jgi:L-fuculose-phosphate aldolase
MKEAMKVCYVVEKTAHIYILSKNIGKCRIIPEEDIKAMQDSVRNAGNGKLNSQYYGK